MNLLHLRQLHFDAEVLFAAIDRSAFFKIYPSCVENKKLKKAMLANERACWNDSNKFGGLHIYVFRGFVSRYF